MKEIDYKKKYLDLRAKMISSMDMAFRMGYEQGATDANQQALQQQVAAQQQAMMGGQPQDGQMQDGAPSDQAMEGQQQVDAQIPGGQDQMQPSVAMPQNEELDQYINELEGLVSKKEISPSDLRKSLEKIKNFSTNTKLAKSIGSKKFQPFKTVLPARASANMTSDDKRNLSMQEKVIEDIMKKWENEAPKTTSQAMQALGVEALTKGE